jgi:uncharacterized membrane protein
MTDEKFEQQVQDPNITSDDKTWALLCYLFGVIFPIIILFIEDKKKRPFLKAHYPQALAYWIVVVVLSFILGLVTFFIAGAGGICVGVLAWIPAIIWGIKAYNGEYVNIPLITDFVKKQGWAD